MTTTKKAIDFGDDDIDDSSGSDFDEDDDPDKIEVPGGGRDLETAVTYAKNSAHSNKNSLLISSASSSAGSASLNTAPTMANKQNANSKGTTGKLQPAQQMQLSQQHQMQQLPSLSQLQAAMSISPSVTGFDALKQQTLSQTGMAYVGGGMLGSAGGSSGTGSGMTMNPTQLMNMAYGGGLPAYYQNNSMASILAQSKSSNVGS